MTYLNFRGIGFLRYFSDLVFLVRVSVSFLCTALVVLGAIFISKCLTDTAFLRLDSACLCLVCNSTYFDSIALICLELAWLSFVFISNSFASIDFCCGWWEGRDGDAAGVQGAAMVNTGHSGSRAAVFSPCVPVGPPILASLQRAQASSPCRHEGVLQGNP